MHSVWRGVDNTEDNTRNGLEHTLAVRWPPKTADQLRLSRFYYLESELDVPIWDSRHNGDQTLSGRPISVALLS